jgi:signal transduction histidine kinase
MIDDLIDVVRLDSGEWRSHLKPHALAPILAAFAKRFAADGALLGRTITGTIAVSDDVVVPLDSRMFTRMLENITGNALRYTDAGGTIDFSAALVTKNTTGSVGHTMTDTRPSVGHTMIDTRPSVGHTMIDTRTGVSHGMTDTRNGVGHTVTDTTGSVVVITVTDDGCGIAEADLPYIFDTFYRGTNSRREEGKGFGLSIVKSVADSYGWTVDVTSALGAGAAFTIRIPV